MMGEQAAPVTRPFEREQDLAVALRSLDPDAWQQLFREHYQRVYNYAYLRTGNTADADDIAANVFVEAVKGIRTFEYRGTPIAAWLFRIAHNETVDALKRARRARMTSLDNPEAVPTLLARDDHAIAEDWGAVSEALGRLKPEHRNVLVLRLVEGRSVRDVARMLGKTEGAVKVMQMRALHALREKLGR